MKVYMRMVFQLGEASLNNKIKHLCFNELHTLGVTLSKAHKGEVLDGGLNGLLITHQNDSIYLDLKTTIGNLYQSILQKTSSIKFWYVTDFTRSQIGGTSNKLPYWPEKFFSDKDWEDAMAISASLTRESVSVEKHLQYFASFVGDQVANAKGSVDLWDQILEVPEGACLLLGPLPFVQEILGTVTRNDIDVLKKAHVKAVLSVAEVFETQSSGFITSPIGPVQWQDAGIKHLQIPISNHQAISNNSILRGVSFINWCLKKNETIMIHCNIDSSRSSFMVMCYMILFKNCSAQNAYDYVRERHPQVSFEKGSEKMDALNKFEKKCSRSWNRM